MKMAHGSLWDEVNIAYIIRRIIIITSRNYKQTKFNLLPQDKRQLYGLQDKERKTISGENTLKPIFLSSASECEEV